jgi:hypothetical protein
VVLRFAVAVLVHRGGNGGDCCVAENQAKIVPTWLNIAKNKMFNKNILLNACK